MHTEISSGPHTEYEKNKKKKLESVWGGRENLPPPVSYVHVLPTPSHFMKKLPKAVKGCELKFLWLMKWQRSG